MTGAKIAIFALGTLGLAAPAFAHEGWYDDHGQYHEELEAQHEADHAQLEAQHEQFHAWNDAAYAQQLQACGWNQACRWLVGRRFQRRHRLEHLREDLEHAEEHEQLSNEHDVYHQVNGGAPYGGAYGGYRYDDAPSIGYVTPQAWWLRFGR